VIDVQIPGCKSARSATARRQPFEWHQLAYWQRLRDREQRTVRKPRFARWVV